MKQAVLEKYGPPEEGVRCIEGPDVGAPGAGEVVFDVLAFPINPADVSMCRGSYRLRPTLPATPGAECIGRVTTVGAGVSHVKPGDLVITLQRENWAQRRRVKGHDTFAVPPGIDILRAPCSINPPKHPVALRRRRPEAGRLGHQNVANSAVGRLLIRLARARGIQTVNVVRRESVRRAAGARRRRLRRRRPGLAETVKATGGAPVTPRHRRGVGRAKRLCHAWEGGVVCNYGSMTGEDPVMARASLIGNGQSLVGFILGRALATRSLDQIRAIYADLGEQVRSGTLHAPVEKIYPLEEIKTALAHAQQGERSGKILVAPNGPIPR
jgi:NADPH:quinone reductase-like Zn-dependent oxidoreductase